MLRTVHAKQHARYAPRTLCINCSKPCIRYVPHIICTTHTTHHVRLARPLCITFATHPVRYTLHALCTFYYTLRAADISVVSCTGLNPIQETTLCTIQKAIQSMLQTAIRKGDTINDTLCRASPDTRGPPNTFATSILCPQPSFPAALNHHRAIQSRRKLPPHNVLEDAHFQARNASRTSNYSLLLLQPSSQDSP